jgi:predicted phage terminase large subunit-like protein
MTDLIQEDAPPVADKVIDWLVGEPPSYRRRALRRHPDTVSVVEQKARQQLAELSPMGLAQSIDPSYRSRPHLDHLDIILARAVKRVEGVEADEKKGIVGVPGESVFIRISEPPRSGKSMLCSMFFPTWVLKKHPEWKIGLISYSDSLAAAWGRQVRRFAEDDRLGLGIKVAHDAGAVKDWETTEGGGVTARSVGMGITGRGFKVMIVDDAVKDYADAHSEPKREALRNWWQTTARTRLEPPSLTLVIGTRWHMDDFTGWVESTGDPFETVEFPAIAEESDVLGREPGDPLLSPLIEETREEALARWQSIRRAVGPYSWASLYQQDPLPAEGAVFDLDWFQYWTRNPDLVSENCRLFDPTTAKGLWVDSWDLASEAKETADYSVGQRWVLVGPDRFLVAQSRKQTAFTETLAKIKKWAEADSELHTGKHVKLRLIEKAAVGRAVLDTLQREVAGFVGIDPRGSKEQRARAITPEIESKHVFLPHPSEAAWVAELLAELQAFPSGKHDDQVDALSQALGRLGGEKPKSDTKAVPQVIEMSNPWSGV